MRNRLPVVLIFAFASTATAFGQGPSRLDQPATPAGVPAELAMLETAQPGTADPVAFAKHAGDLAASLPRVEWSVPARAEALGPGVEPAFVYVRDRVRYEAYAGVLRGAAGTYVARAGNAVDRALLLARLLECQHVRTRFAFGALAPADCERLWQRTFDTSIPLARGADVGATASGTAFRQRIGARARRDFGFVRGALGDRLPPVSSPSRADVLAEMNPHVWVQAEIDGKWLDLDPSFPDAKAGAVLAAAERTAAELPAGMFQRVSIRVVVEQLKDGNLVSDTVLELTRNAVDLVDQQVFVVHAPGKQAMGNLGSALGGHADWTPAVWIGGEFNWGRMFTIEEGGAPARAGGPRRGGVGGAFDALSDDSPPAAGPGPVFVAEWLEFELSAPASPREITRRVLAERGSVAWRASRPLDPKGLRPLHCDAQGPFAMRAMHNVWFSAGPHDLAAYADAMQDLAIDTLSLACGEGPKEAPDFGASVWPFALQNFAWMVWTDHAVIPELNRTPGLRLYADRPRIAIFTMAPDANDTGLVLSDLRRDDLRAIAADPGQGDQLAAKKLWFGLLQGALEQEGLAQLLVSFGADPAAVVTTSSHLQRDGVAVLMPGAPLPAKTDRESSARITAALDARTVVVAPWSGLSDGSWWEITAGTGDVRSMGELGLHSGGGPFRIINKIQQNPVGGTKPSYTGDAIREIRDKARRRQNDKRILDNIKNYQERQNNLARAGARRAGSEYTVLLVAVVVVNAAAHAVIAYYIATSMLSAVEALSTD